ncbi:LysR family transcriptional regulator [Nocardioides insulae]|uniref:LysR family transcriptional regulator n=1 Tax=Nocardioides insulae TaxID=394734 RepID=UPI0006844F4E|nr:LysR family transcriptional regulator [Nocardioides insulae]
MNTRHLEYFLAVVDHGGFNRAAAHLRVAQPSLSQAIRALERELKVVLFVRTSRQSVLTDVGRSLVGPTRQVLRDISAIESIGLEQDEDLHGDVTVAMSSSVAYGVLPKVTSGLQLKHPLIRIAVHPVPNIHQAADLVRTGICDLGFATSPQAPREQGLKCELVFEDRFAVVAPPGMFKDAGTVTREQLRGVRFVVGEQATERDHLTPEFTRWDIYPDIAVWAGHSEAVIPLVLSGAGAAMLPTARAKLARLGGAAVFEIDPPVPLRQWMVSRPGPLNRPANAFYERALAIRDHTGWSPCE